MIKKKFIPTIDISSLLDNKFKSDQSINTIKKIEKACLEVGFFQVVGHGISLKKINKLCKIGKEFFKSSYKNKLKLAPKKWNTKNTNLYRGYFPNDVNGKEGLDLGDLNLTKFHCKKFNSQYIEFLNIKKSLKKKSIKEISNYFDNIFLLSETIFKSIIKIYKKDINLSK